MPRSVTTTALQRQGDADASPRLRRRDAAGPVGLACAAAQRPLSARAGFAISIPLLLDAVGNAAGIYQRKRIDDLVHLANGAIVAGVGGSLVAPHVDERWQAALAGAGIGITAQTLWEIMEYVAYRFGARGMDLSYQDTMDDMIESTIGALVGGAFTLTRVPRAKSERRTGWRSVVGA